MSGAPVLLMTGVSKTYNALRPLRIASLVVAGERVSLGGVDAGAGELLINLVTGASVPDKGDIRIFGRLTTDIANGEEWLTLLERFGIVSPRAVMLEGSTLLQNLAMPFTLEIDPVPAEVVAKVQALARNAVSIRRDGCRSLPASCLRTSGCSRIWRARSPSVRSWSSSSIRPWMSPPMLEAHWQPRSRAPVRDDVLPP